MHSDLVMHPSRGGLLQLSHEVGQAVSGLQSNKKMHVVRSPTGTLRESTQT